MPIRFTRYGLVPDSGGAGRARGGMATELEIGVFSPNTVITARNRDRTRFAAWGGSGGKAGQCSTFWRRNASGAVEDLGNTDVVRLDPGDVINLTSGGGAVSAAMAEQEYGVVLAGGVVDEAATAALRAGRAGEAPAPLYAYNASRIAFEAVWTPANYAELTRILTSVPVSWRHFVKQSVFAELAALPAARRGDGSEVRAALSAVTGRLPQLRGFSNRRRRNDAAGPHRT